MSRNKLAKYRNKRRRKANPEKKEAIEMAANVGAGFAGYAATRLLSRMAYSQAVKRYPGASAYVHVAASAVGAAGVYFGSKHWSKVDEYHEAASIGAGIALLQTAIQTLVPKFGWVVSDVSADQYGAGKKEKSILPDADLTQILPPDEIPDALPEASADLGDFDIDALLASDSSIEAVPIGQAPSVEPQGDFDEAMLGFGEDDFGEGPLEHFNGMLQ